MSGTIVMTHTLMPAEYRQLVMPSQLKLANKKGSRYIPRFDASSNTCWWEWYPTAQEQDADGWQVPKHGSGYHQRRRERLARKHNDCDEERIVGEESFLDGDNAKSATSPPDVEFEQVMEAAWVRFEEENQRRSQMASAWIKIN